MKYIDTKEAFTHGGNFHADDVFSAALLKILNPDIKIIRGFQKPENFDGITFDIGGGIYDHHKKKETRENGVPYASFGKLWRTFGSCIVNEKQQKDIDVRIVQPIDAADNHEGLNPLTIFINGFNPDWDSDDDVDTCFERAVTVAETLLRRQIALCQARERATARVKEIYESAEDKEIIVFDRYIPFADVLIKKKMPKFVILPSPRGGYNIQTIQKDFNDKTPKCALPESWYGKSGEELQNISGYSSAQFCHPNGFLMLCNDLTDAKEICKKLLGRETQPQKIDKTVYENETLKSSKEKTQEEKDAEWANFLNSL